VQFSHQGARDRLALAPELLTYMEARSHTTAALAQRPRRWFPFRRCQGWGRHGLLPAAEPPDDHDQARLGRAAGGEPSTQVVQGGGYQHAWSGGRRGRQRRRRPADDDAAQRGARSFVLHAIRYVGRACLACSGIYTGILSPRSTQYYIPLYVFLFTWRFWTKDRSLHLFKWKLFFVLHAI
jgi:hypothetical protein